MHEQGYAGWLSVISVVDNSEATTAELTLLVFAFAFHPPAKLCTELKQAQAYRLACIAHVTVSEILVSHGSITVDLPYFAGPIQSVTLMGEGLTNNANFPKITQLSILTTFVQLCNMH